MHVASRHNLVGNLGSKVTGLTLAGLGFVGLLAGCSNRTEATPATSASASASPGCRAGQSIPFDTNATTKDSLQAILGVNPTQIEKATVVIAQCEPGIPADNLADGNEVIEVANLPPGFESTCLALYVDGLSLPSATSVQTVAALCPATETLHA